MTTPIPPILLTLPLDKIVPSPLNPRRHSKRQLTPAALRPLGENMLAVGQKEYLTVRPHPTLPNSYELANGERRLKAAQLVGMPTLNALVHVLTDVEMFDLMLATGGNSEPLTPMAEAHGYYERMALENINIDQLAKQLGLERDVVSRRLMLLELPEDAQAAVDEGVLPYSVGAVIASVPGEKERLAFAQEVLHPTMQDTPLSYRAAVAARGNYSRTLKGAPFDLKDGALVPGVGTCKTCPFYAGANPVTYGDVPNKHTCMQPSCYDAKALATRAKLVEEFKAKGLEPLTEEENARAFPAGEDGLSYKVDLVEYQKPVPRDLLKAEVMDAPKWKDIANGADVAVVVRIGFDQSGTAVELVRVGEAICAADENEQAIFNEATRVRYGLEKQKPQHAPKPAVEVPSDKGQVTTEETPEDESHETADNGLAGGEDPEQEPEFNEHEAVVSWMSAVISSVDLPPTLRLQGELLLARLKEDAE